MRKTVIILSAFALISGSCGRVTNNKQQQTETNEFIADDLPETKVEIPITPDNHGQFFHIAGSTASLASLEYIPYNVKEIDDYGHTIKLNGEPIRYLDLSLFLAPDNIESVAVNKSDQIVYITQKKR
ncbi:MAG: hypothetical protein FWD60_06170 [Candidatus Azobacteroides sp.]|nr:hypothetical protein [Candidatus Azobacteroides sp.]